MALVEVWKAKFFMNRMIACNKDLNAKENSVELTVSVSQVNLECLW